MSRAVTKLESVRSFREGGGFVVRRAVSDAAVLEDLDPIFRLDHMGPVTYGPREALGAVDHPHRAIAAATYLISGESLHYDTLGNITCMKTGDFQWIHCGAGALHAEMPSGELFKNGGEFEGFQIWVSLPQKDKFSAPSYQRVPAADIPLVKSSDGKTTVKVLAGENSGAKASVTTNPPILFLDVHILSGGTHVLSVPQDFNLLAYVWRGAGSLGRDSKPAREGQVAVLSKGDKFEVAAEVSCDIHVLVLGALPLNEPVAKGGPFLMNSLEEVQQAFADAKAGKLGSIDGAGDRKALTVEAVENQKKSGHWQKQEENLTQSAAQWPQ